MRKPRSVKIKKRTVSPAERRAIRRPAEQVLAELKLRLAEIGDLRAAAGVLGWDQATYMPPAGAAARARHAATVSRIAHERWVAPEIGKLIDAVVPYGERLPYDSDDASLIRVARREYDRAVRIPAAYVARASAHHSAAYDAWTRARPANDFAAMVPFLQTTLDLSREYSGFFAPYDHVADPHVAFADPGMTAAAIGKLFTGLRRELVPLVRAICDQPPADDSCLRQNFPQAAQLEFARHAAACLGYDLDRGRLDLTHHPFATRFAVSDVRITTRVNEHDLGDAFFSTIHEAGHAMYEQGISAAIDGVPLGQGASSGIHESQSRLWENVVGRSANFWNYFYPLLQRTFPAQLGGVAPADFYRAINKVSRSLIRTDADEVTYNLHVMLRFDLELKMLEGKLPVKDLAEAWRAGVAADLGITPPDDRDGCLQDVHWFSGAIGGQFQSYTIGNILAAQFYAAALRAHPEIPDEIARGGFGTLHSWLRDTLYRHGSKYLPDELVSRVTGEAMSTEPYLDYLRGKYGALYRLPQPVRAFDSVTQSA